MNITDRILNKAGLLDVSKYWQEPGNGNNPEDYWSKTGRSEYLYEFIKDVIPKDKRLLELGCNCGRNVKYLVDRGYKVSGIDIRQEAIDFGKQRGVNNIETYKIEDYFRSNISEIDVIYTMAVLEHIPIKSEWIFERMARLEYVIVIEDEISKNWTKFPRNYKEVFENLGMKEIKHQTEDTGLFCTKFEARIFWHIRK